MTRVDVLVVGAGPAGATTAYHLARRGVDVLMVDKAAFPREKVCGDGLTPRGVRALLDMGIDVADPAFVRIDGLRSHGDGVVIDLPWPTLESLPSFGVVRTRHDLDHLLVRQGVRAGVALWERAEAVAPLTEGGWVTGAVVRRDGGATEEVEARMVVAADGAASRFAGQAGVRRDPARPIGIAARRYYRSPRAQEPRFESWLNLREDGSTLPGYGWIFPVGDGVLNVGAGLLNTFRDFKEVSARRVFDIFVGMLPPEWEITEENAEGPVLSGPLPMGTNRRPLSVPGLLVAGDAGGLINPFNGEGIAYAMESGELAADLIHEAVVMGRTAVAHAYPFALRERYGRYFTLGRAFVRMIGNPHVMHAAVSLGLPRERLMRFLLKVMANLSDGPDGDADDRAMDLLLKVTPER